MFANKYRRVSIYCNYLLPWSETFILEQLKALRAWQPILVGQRRVSGGLPLEGLNVSLLPESIARSRLLTSLAGRMGRALGLPYWPQVMKLRAIECDLIHAHFGTDATDIWPIANALQLPMLVTLHGYDINTSRAFWESGKGGEHRIHYPRRLLQMAAEPKVGFIAVSEAMRRSAIAYGIPPEKIVVSHIGVDIEHFKPTGRPLAERRPRILFVGRFVEQKGPLQMIRAFAQVAAKIPGSELVMLGDGPLLEAAGDLARELKVDVMFPGAASRNQVAEHMQDARLLCFPSTGEEGLGMVLLEAQACGLPVVSTARGGALEAYIDGETGINCPENDCDQLALALERCLTDETLFQRMSNAASAFARNRFNLIERTRSLEDIYEQHRSRHGRSNNKVEYP